MLSFRILLGLMFSFAFLHSALAETEKPYHGWDPSIQQDIDGRKLPVNKQYPAENEVKHIRPWIVEQHKSELVVENLHIHNVTNQKAIDIILTSFDRPTPVPNEPNTFSKVVVRNCEVNDIWRDEVGAKAGLHIDFLRVCGGGDQQPFPTDLLVEDFYMHDGNALPILVQDGKYNTITLRRVRLEKSYLGSVQIGVVNCGHVKQLIVEDSPGLRVALMGPPGAIEQAIVRNSPGAFVRDTKTPKGVPGTHITVEDGHGGTAQYIGEMPDPGTGSVVNGAPAVKPADTPVKLNNQPSTDTNAKPTHPAVISSAKLKAEPSKDGSSVHISLDKLDESNVAFVVFEAFDSFDYRQGAPVVVTQKPFQADIKLNRTGTITCKATVTRLGGEAEAPLSTSVEVSK